MVRKYLRTDMRVLDLGAGRGKPGPANFADAVSAVVGLDPDPALEENRLLSYRVRGRAETLPFRAQTFDAVYSDWVLEHLDHPSLMAAELFRVLRPGGTFLFRTGNLHHYSYTIAAHTPHWFHQLAANRLRGLAPETGPPHPTHYRINTLRDLRYHLGGAGFIEEELLTVEAEPSYLMFSVPSFLLGVAYERLVNRVDSLKELRACLLGCFRKRPAAAAALDASTPLVRQPPRTADRV